MGSNSARPAIGPVWPIPTATSRSSLGLRARRWRGPGPSRACRAGSSRRGRPTLGRDPERSPLPSVAGVECDPVLVAVVCHRVQALALVAGTLVARVLTARPLDLDDLGAHVAQECAHNGPATNRLRSRTQIPSSGASGPAIHRMSPPTQSHRSSSKTTAGARAGARARSSDTGCGCTAREEEAVVAAGACRERATPERSRRGPDGCRSADGAGPSRQQHGQVVPIGRQQGHATKSPKPNGAKDHESADVVALAPSPQTSSPGTGARQSDGVSI